jgi:RNase P/RNase MRP subunit p30
MPEIWAPHESMSLFAIIGAATPTAIAAVTREAPMLMKRRFRLRSKKRFQVKISVAGAAGAG